MDMKKRINSAGNKNIGTRGRNWKKLNVGGKLFEDSKQVLMCLL
jgi:hypothetical protein